MRSTSYALRSKDEPTMYETYRKLICCYYICLDLCPSHENVNNLKSLVEYVFSVVDGPLENLQTSVSDKRITRAMTAGEHGSLFWRRVMVNTSEEILS